MSVFRKKLLETLNSLCKHRRYKRITVNGVSKDEIKSIEESFEVQLPKVYIDFLEVTGKSPDIVNSFNMIAYQDFFEWKDIMDEEIKSGEIICNIPADMFIIGQYGGDQFWGIKCDGNDDPPVQYISFGESEIYPVPAKDLSSWILGIIEHAEMNADASHFSFFQS